MSSWEALFLGIIQGITEFLPVSSSGHLELGQYLLGFQSLQKYILFSLVCHLGTLGSIFLVFHKQIKEAFFNHQQLFIKITLGTLPLFPLVLLLKPIKAVFDQPEYLGFCFLITAALIFASLSVRWHPPKQRWFDPVAIGLFQALAILPGISRSGATISAARILGWSKEEAIQFSFLLAIPAILGATVLELWQFVRMPASAIASITLWQFAIGFITSFVVGCAALKFLQKIMLQNKWHYFAWYCLFIGFASIWYFNLFG